jgi:hypothetical protein
VIGLAFGAVRHRIGLLVVIAVIIVFATGLPLRVEEHFAPVDNPYDDTPTTTEPEVASP